MTRLKNFAAILVVLIINLGCLYVMWPDDGNSDNIILHGYVHEQPNGQPAANCAISIFNCIAIGDSIHADTKLFTKTDANGYYEIEIEKSCQMYIRAFKENYIIARSGMVSAQPDTEQNFMLSEGNSTQEDFLKEQQVSEMID